jgi:phosphoribulokinase
VSDTQPAANAAPFVLGVIGDSGSGKSTVCNAVRALIGPESVADLRLDDYLKLTRAERRAAGLTSLNPAVHDFELMHAHLQLLRAGRGVRIRRYEHANGTFGATRAVEPRDIVLVRGLLGFPTDNLREAYDLGVFLHPEPELLFRWKLRRDVRSRGYTHAEVLNYIARHLLDSKEFVLPQAERADVVVRYELPAWDSADSELQATLVLRRAAADALPALLPSLERFGAAIVREQNEDEVVLRLQPGLTREEVQGWAAEAFPATPDFEAVGRHKADDGEVRYHPQLAFVEVLIACLAQEMRRRAPRRRERSAFLRLPEQLDAPATSEAGDAGA